MSRARRACRASSRAAAPELAAHEDHRELVDLAGLHEGQRLEQLVHRPEAAGADDERLRVLDEHRLAGEEVAELDAEVDPLVQALLEGQLDPEPDRQARRPRWRPRLAASMMPGPPPVMTAQPASASAPPRACAIA
jgi:hypothetical protein